MTWITYTRAQVMLSQTVFWKRLGVALVGTLLPLGFGILGPINVRGGASIEGLSPEEFLLIGFLGFALFFVMYNLVNSTTSRRDSLIYKRLRATALPDSSIFAGEALSASVTSVSVVAILIGYGLVYLKLPAPSNVPLLILGIVLGAAVFAFLAIGLSGILPSAEMSMWIVTPIMVALLMISGILAPLSNLPSVVGDISQYTPLTAVVSILRTAYTGQDFSSVTDTGVHNPVSIAQGLRVSSSSIGVLIAWSAASFAIGRKLFRWDPRRS